ncbi:MAG TPA: urease accessory protein UreD [Candidatus Acidoferrales bacterium]|jgi:urease accessory protein|nr:urease accessory protein UreD [Candidatus Acidoferrales bacterium]
MSSPATAKDTQPIGALAPARVEASLALDFARDAATGGTVLSASLQEPPLRVVRAFALEDGSALAHLHNVSGGLLGGDRLSLAVNVGAGASVQLTTTGGTRIYRPRGGAPATLQTNAIRVGAGALLEYVPDAIIPYAGARFAQRTRIDLSAGAGLFWWEVIAPGREASGEVFAYERIEMHTEITSNGRPIAAENIRLDPRGSALRSIARLGEYRYWATFYICRAGLDAAAWLAAEEHLREAARELSRPGQALWGVSTLLADGLVVRGLAVRGRDALGGLHALWNVAKLRLYGRPAVPPRKVN